MVTATSTPVAKAASALHDSVVAGIIGYLKARNWQVTSAAVSGYPEPPKVGRHEPDVVAQDAGGLVCFGEAKTGNGDLGTAHSREQYQDFSQRVMQDTSTSCPFYVCVPRASEADLVQVLKEEGVSSKANVHVLVHG